MRNIVLPNGRADVVHQHVSDLFASALALEEVTTKHNRSSLGHVLVLRNGLYLVRRKVTKADQVYK